MAIPEEKPTGLKDVLIGLAILCLPPLILIQGAGLPSLLLWPAWLVLFMLSMAVQITSAGVVYCECALPYRGVSPVPGGPAMRPVNYHPQLQRRVGTGTRLDWINWAAGICLRGGSFVVVLVVVAVLLMEWIPASWGFCGFVLAYDLATVAAGLVAAPLLTFLMQALRGFWSSTEPPEVALVEPEGIGVSRPSPSLQRRIWALLWRFTPLPALLLGLTAGPVLAFPAQGLRLAWLGVAVAAVLGYPVWTWSDYQYRKLSDS